MSIWKLLSHILRYVRPYRWLVVVTLALTLIGSLLAQVNAIVLDRSVDAINVLDQQPSLMWSSAVRILTIISAVLLGKELLATVVNFFRRYYGERMRILVSRDLSLQVVRHILTFRMAFYTTSGNEAGRLQSRIDKGVTSVSRAVNSLFIDILPLFSSAVLALILMFAANFYYNADRRSVITHLPLNLSKPPLSQANERDNIFPCQLNTYGEDLFFLFPERQAKITERLSQDRP